MEKKFKFAVGDKVIGNAKANNYSITKTGWVGTVTAVNDTFFKAQKSTDDTNFTLEYEKFDLYETINTTQEIRVTVSGRKTIATLFDNDKEVRSAFAMCNPSDKFDFKAGAELAIQRLFEEIKTEIIPQSTYAVGDTVKVKEAGKSNSTCSICGSFRREHAGKTVKIVAVRADGNYKTDVAGACGLRKADIEGKVVTTSVLTTPVIKEVSGKTRFAKIGEYIRVETTMGHSVPVGSICEVTALVPDGSGYVRVDGAKQGDAKCIRPDQYTILEGYVPTNKPVKKVSRRAKVGEYVEIVKRAEGVDIRDICEVISEGDFGMYVRSKRNSTFNGDASRTPINQPFTYITVDKYLVLENYVPEVKTVKRKAKVGESVIITEPWLTGGTYSKGDLMVVKKVEGTGFFTEINNKNMFIDDKEYEVIVK